MPNIVDKNNLQRVFTAASYNRGNGQPLDDTLVWGSYDELVKYAADPAERSYAGQVVSVATESGSEVFVITSVSQGKHTITEENSDGEEVAVEYDVYLQAVAGTISDEQIDRVIGNRLDGKLDLQTTTGSTYAYTVKGTKQGLTRISQSVSSGHIPLREAGGAISVPKTPDDDDHAASKLYVDQKTYGMLSNLEGSLYNYASGLKWKGPFSVGADSDNPPPAGISVFPIYGIELNPAVRFSQITGDNEVEFAPFSPWLEPENEAVANKLRAYNQFFGYGIADGTTWCRFSSFVRCRQGPSGLINDMPWFYAPATLTFKLSPFGDIDFSTFSILVVGDEGTPLLTSTLNGEWYCGFLAEELPPTVSHYTPIIYYLTNDEFYNFGQNSSS